VSVLRGFSIDGGLGIGGMVSVVLFPHQVYVSRETMMWFVPFVPASCRLLEFCCGNTHHMHSSIILVDPLVGFELDLGLKAFAP